MIYTLDERISQALEDAYDPETGELVISEEDLCEVIEQITGDFNATIDSIASEMKNTAAEAAAVKAEKLSLAQRQTQLEKKADRLKRLLAYLLHGEKFSNGRHSISYRKSTELVFDDEFISWAEMNAPGLLRYRDPEPMKDEIKAAIKNGTYFDHVFLQEKQNIQVR